MNRRSSTTALTLFFLLGIALTASARAQAAPDELPSNSFMPQAGQSAAAAREDELYKEGSTYLDEGKWQQALEKFTAVADMKSRRADAALFWKAYAHSKLGHRAEALATVAELRKQYPQSKWVKDADALSVEIKQSQGQRVSPENTSDEDLKLLALNSLMNSDEERAIPLLEGVLRSNNSPRIKERALFVLAQSGSPKAQQVIASVAKGQTYPEMQVKAIQYLGTNGTEQNKKSLVEIYHSTNSREIKRTVLHAFLTC